MTDSVGKLFVLEASGAGRLFSINPDGSDKTTLVTGCPVRSEERRVGKEC